MKFWNKFSLTARIMLLSLVGLFAGFLVLGSIIIVFVYPFETLPKFLAGLSFGCVVTAVRVAIMDVSIDKEVDLPEKKASNYHQLMFFVRYAILIAFAVVLVVFKDVFGVFGGMIGVLCMQLSAYCANFFLAKIEKKKKAQKAQQGVDNQEVE